MKTKFARIGLAGIALAMLFGLLAAGSQRGATAQGPTPTPNDPTWLAFDAARTALEEELQQDIRLVRSYTYEEAEFEGGISACRTLQEGESEEFLFFGWRFIITLLNGSAYEVRTSFNYQIVVVCDEVTTVAPTAVPSTANPNNPAPVVAPVGPGGLEVGGHVTGLFPNVRTALNNAGMRWVKKQITPNVSAATAVAFINEAHAAGYKVLLSVIGDIPSVMDPNRQNDYAQFVAYLASQGADAIEVWNEPNLDREWPAGQISGANYTQLLIRAYNAIKAARPQTLVISGAPAPTGAAGAAGCTPNFCNDDVFFRQMAQAGAGNYLDCVGVHYNEGIVSPTQSTGDPRDNYPTRYYGTNLNRALSQFPGKQACLTEIGYLTGEGYPPIPSGFAWAAGNTIAEQAQWFGEAVRIARAAGNVRLFIVFNVDFTTYTDDPQAGYAIIRADGSCPACATIRASLN